MHVTACRHIYVSARMTGCQQTPCFIGTYRIISSALQSPSQVLRLQREALFSKAARQAAEAQLSISRQHLAYLRTQSDHLGAAKEGSGVR